MDVGLTPDNRADTYVPRDWCRLVTASEFPKIPITMATENIVSCFGIYCQAGNEYLLAHVLDVDQLERLWFRYRLVLKQSSRIVVVASQPQHPNYLAKLKNFKEKIGNKNVEYILGGSMVVGNNYLFVSQNLCGDIYTKHLCSQDPLSFYLGDRCEL